MHKIAILTLMALAGGAARAQTGAWTLGTNGSWNDPANWAGGIIASGATQTAFFTGPTNVTVSQDDSALVIGNLYFSNFNFTVSNQLTTLDNGAAQPVITVGGSARSATLSAPLGGTNGLLATGEGTLNLSGTNDALTGRLVVIPTVAANNNNAGVVLLGNGAIGGMTNIVVSNNAYVAINGGVTLAAEVALELSGAGGLSAPQGTLRGNGANTVTNVVHGPITLTGAGSAPRLANGGAAQLTLHGPITALSSNTTVVFRFNDNNGVFITNTNNAWGGLTQLSQGGFRSLPGAMPSNTLVAVAVSADGYWETFGTITRALGTAQNTHQIDLSAGATNGRVNGLSARGGPLTVDFGGAGAVAKWGVPGFRPGVFLLNSSRADSTLTLVNGLDFNGSMRTIRVDAATSVLAGGATNSSTTNAAAFIKTGNGRLLLAATNLFDGPVTVAAGTLGVAGDYALGIPAGANSTNLVFTGSATLQAASDVTTIGAGRQLAYATNLTVTLDSQTNQLVFDGTILGGSLVNAGAGTTVLAGTNTLMGSLNANAGLLRISGLTRLTYGTNAGSPYAVQAGNLGGSTGVVTVTDGGVLYCSNASVKVANAANATAILNVLPGATVLTEITPAYLSSNDVGNQAHFVIGEAVGSIGVVNQSGGSVAVSDQFFVGHNAGSYGFYNLVDGSLIATGQANPYLRSAIARFRVGASSTGLLYQAGGSITVNVDRISVAYNAANSRGVIYLTGGRLVAPVNALNAANQGGARGEITVAGSALLSVGGAMSIGESTNNALTVLNLNGGTTRTRGILSTAGAGVLNLNGGTLVAAAHATNFVQGLVAAYVRPGGAIVDTAGFDISLGQPLLAPPGDGVGGIAVSGSGGFVGAPYVSITGGGGSNATAVALLDGGGNVTGLVVTSAGENYTGAPTVELRGGGGSSGVLAPALAANASGGLTKQGAGLLVSSNANTYTGTTAVEGGSFELREDGSVAASTSIVVAAGAALIVTGRTDAALSLPATQRLSGEGSVLGNVNNDGVVAPGLSAGLLAITGNYVQAGGTLDIEIGGTSGPGVDYDQLAIAGTATLGGTLNVGFIGGYTGAAGDTFVVLSAAGGSGTFAATNLPALGAGQGWNVLYPGGSLVVLSVTGAPSATGFDAYALQIPNAAQRGLADDPDGDGYANLLEYVTGGSPTNADQIARMNGGRTNGVLSLRFTRTTGSTDATLYVEGSHAATNNAAWQNVAINSNGLWISGTAVETGGPNPVNVTVQDTDPAATNRFLRLRVTRP